MNQFETIRWIDLPGNKYTKSLDAAMLSEGGYTFFGKVRHSSEPKGTMRNVIYDREYVIHFLIKRVLFALAVLPKETIGGLIDEAWQELHGMRNKLEQKSDVAN